MDKQLNLSFRSFLQFHREGEEPLRDDEISILNGVLSLNNKNVSEIMTSMEVCTLMTSLFSCVCWYLEPCNQDVFTISSDQVLNHDILDRMWVWGTPSKNPSNFDSYISQIEEWLLTYPGPWTRTSFGLCRSLTYQEGALFSIQTTRLVLISESSLYQLSVYDPSQEWPVSKFPLSILPEANPTINCFQALDYL